MGRGEIVISKITYNINGKRNGLLYELCLNFILIL